MCSSRDGPGSERPSALARPQLNNQRLAVRAEHDVTRLEVAVDHPTAVGISDGVADVDEPPQQLAEFDRACAGITPRFFLGVVKPSYGVPQTASLEPPFDEPHRVKRPAVLGTTQAIDRHNPRVLQAPGHLGLEQKARPEPWIIGIGCLNRLRAQPRGSIRYRARRRLHRALPAHADAGSGNGCRRGSPVPCPKSRQDRRDVRPPARVGELRERGLKVRGREPAQTGPPGSCWLSARFSVSAKAASTRESCRGNRS